MPNSTPSSIDCFPLTWQTATAVSAGTARRARTCPDTFLAACFLDPVGEPIRQAGVHRDLQAFLTTHPRALIELPRDHGKSVQVCGRVLWELGRNPGLRVKLVCATEGLAAQRSRFLRDAIADNPVVQTVFPDLKPGAPWAA